MNDIDFKINDKQLIANNTKDSKQINCSVDSINAIFISKISNSEAKQQELAIRAITDYDDKMLIYKSTDQEQVKAAYKSLVKTLKAENPCFRNYFPRCINMEKVHSIGWNKVPFKYIATIDFGKSTLQFRTFENEFNKLIEDLRFVKSKETNRNIER